MTRDRARNAICGPFVADAAAAGLHWVYDVDAVRRRGGDAPEFADPSKSEYHSKRKAGDFTHYGDHALVALESIAECGGLDPDDYRERYVARFGAEGYDGYLDHATKDLLRIGAGADDNQAGCFAKLAPVVARYVNDPELGARVEAAVRVTHDNVQAVRYSRAAAQAIRVAILGGSPAQAVGAVAEGDGAPAEAARKALAASPDAVAFAEETGQTCPVPNALPVALQAALHAPDFKAAVRQSILSGGDTSGRLLVTAAIRGATDGIPGDWWERVRARARVEELTEKLLANAALD